MVDDAFAGRSLFLVRHLLRCPARWHSAKEAARTLPLNTVNHPQVASVVFYASEPFGHCGLYVGDEQALTVTWDGEIKLFPYDDPHYWGGPYLGYVDATTFALRSVADPDIPL